MECSFLALVSFAPLFSSNHVNNSVYFHAAGERKSFLSRHAEEKEKEMLVLSFLVCVANTVPSEALSL